MRAITPLPIVLGVILALTSCTASSDADPSDATQSNSIDAAVATQPMASTTTTSSSTTSTTTSTTIEPTTTTLAPAAAYVEGICTQLPTAGYETRTSILSNIAVEYTAAGGTDDGVAAVRAACPDPVTRTDEALAIEQRSAAMLDAGESAYSITDATCEDPGVMSITVTNRLDHPIGALVEISIRYGDSETEDQSSREPIVIWSLEPGASTVVTGDLVFGTTQNVCTAGITPFDATPGTADASLATADHPELTGDDPAVWFPALVALEKSSTGSGDVDLAAVTEDVRSMSYTDVLAATTDQPVPDPTAQFVYTVCDQGRTQPDPDHMSLVYFAEFPDRTIETKDGPQFFPAETRLLYGVFRRGNDGQWRWLASAAYFNSVDYWDTCGRPSAND